MSRISVLLPVRNGLPYLSAAIQSVLSQSFTDFELIVIDDGSSDGSADAVRAIRDDRIRLLSTGGAGVAAALQAGLGVATGEFIARQDADDLSDPDRFARQVSCIDRHPRVAVVSSRVRFIDHNGDTTANGWTRMVRSEWERATTPADIATLMPKTCCIVHGSVMMRRSAVVAAGGYDARLPVAQDYDLWLRLLPLGEFVRLPDELYAFRIHDAQISATRRHEQARHAIGAKLRYLASTAALPVTPRTRIIGDGTGAELYRQAFREAGWRESSGSSAWDVAVFTNFATVDNDMHAVMAADTRSLVPIGNFLVSGGMP